MKRLALILAFLSALMLLGCIGGGENPPPAQNNTSVQANTTNKTPITIITEPQKNQTTESNITKPPPVVTNHTDNDSIDYINDPTKPTGIYFIDVGAPLLHGNAIFIKKGDLDIVVDAGPEQSAGKVLDFLQARGVDDIDVLISTNADPRNYGGIGTLLDNYPIEQLWWNGDARNDQGYDALIKRASGKTKKTEIVAKGFDKTLNGIRIEALNPSAPMFSDINNDAIVLKITDRNSSLLITSGIQTGAQGKLVNDKGVNLTSDIMEAPYYGVGAGTSNIQIFLLSVRPKDVIITGSSDETAPNGGSRDPFRRTLNMTQYQIRWQEVYRNGTIRVTMDDNGYGIKGLGSGQ